MTQNIASLIDHTLLRPDATIKEITQLCEEAKKHAFHSVCVQSYWISTARQLLAGSPVKIATVVAFPHGATLTKGKVQETHAAIEAGADEIDFVINIGAAKEGHWDFLENEMREIVSAANGREVKAILEVCYLNEAQITEATTRAVKAGCHFIKTSTGFGPSGATVEAIKLMRKAAGCTPGIKASGGIKDRASAEALIEAGATRLGTSASVSLLKAK